MNTIKISKQDILELEQMHHVVGGGNSTSLYGCERIENNGTVKVDPCKLKSCPAKKDPSILRPTPKSIEGEVGVGVGPVKAGGNYKNG